MMAQMASAIFPGGASRMALSTALSNADRREAPAPWGGTIFFFPISPPNTVKGGLAIYPGFTFPEAGPKSRFSQIVGILDGHRKVTTTENGAKSGLISG